MNLEPISAALTRMGISHDYTERGQGGRLNFLQICCSDVGGTPGVNHLSLMPGVHGSILLEAYDFEARLVFSTYLWSPPDDGAGRPEPKYPPAVYTKVENPKHTS